MKEFLTSRGWTFSGSCGCTPKLDSYIHANYSGWEFMVGSAHFNLKKKNGVGVKNVVASGRQDTIEVIYNQHING